MNFFKLRCPNCSYQFRRGRDRDLKRHQVEQTCPQCQTPSFTDLNGVRILTGYLIICAILIILKAFQISLFPILTAILLLLFTIMLVFSFSLSLIPASQLQLQLAKQRGFFYLPGLGMILGSLILFFGSLYFPSGSRLGRSVFYFSLVLLVPGLFTNLFTLAHNRKSKIVDWTFILLGPTLIWTSGIFLTPANLATFGFLFLGTMLFMVGLISIRSPRRPSGI